MEKTIEDFKFRLFLIRLGVMLRGVIGEYFHDRLIQVDEIFLNPDGYNHEKIDKAYEKYARTKARR